MGREGNYKESPIMCQILQPDLNLLAAQRSSYYIYFNILEMRLFTRRSTVNKCQVVI